MIITKAYITEMPKDGDNVFKVNVPLMADNSTTDAIFNALLCTTPGSYKGYSVGDCVFVGFEDEKYNTAIIFGKLYVSVPSDSTVYEIVNELKVTDYASLPPNTKFGDHTAQDFTNLYNAALNSGNGTIDDEDLKQYVKWTNTERENPEGEIEDIYSNKIRNMTGKEWDKYKKSEEFDADEFKTTLYFLSSIPDSEEEN